MSSARKNISAHFVFYIFIVTSLFFACTCKHIESEEIVLNNLERTNLSNFKIEKFVTGLRVPWSFEFIDEDQMIIAERPGVLRLVQNKKLLPKPIADLSEVVAQGEGGLMGMTLHPEFSKNNWIYLCYTQDNPQMVTVNRYELIDQKLSNEKNILQHIPSARLHVGCRLRFGPEKKLYISTGDALEKNLAQNLNSLAGKILRVNDDGSIPSDNPFANKVGARAEIWSIGHRNPQGFDWHKENNFMWATEHGPSGFDGPGGGDEINLIEKGKNYGWPEISHQEKKAGLISPSLEFTPAIAPSGGSFYFSDKIPEWKGDFFVTALRGQALYRVRTQGKNIVGYEQLFHKKFGRIRNVIEGPDGALYFSSSNQDGRGDPSEDDDQIFRVSKK